MHQFMLMNLVKRQSLLPCTLVCISGCPSSNAVLRIAGCPTPNALLRIVWCPTLNALLRIARCPTPNALLRISVPYPYRYYKEPGSVQKPYPGRCTGPY